MIQKDKEIKDFQVTWKVYYISYLSIAVTISTYCLFLLLIYETM